MDATAIKEIQESANIKTLRDQLLLDGLSTDLALVPNSMKIESLEQYNEFAARYRLHFNTSSIVDFIEYNKKFDQEGAACFVEPVTMKAKSIFDLGTVDAPLHKQNKASLSLKKTAGFRAILELCDRKRRQKEAADFIIDWNDFIEVLDLSGKPMPNGAAVSSFSDLTIERAKEVNSKVSDFGAEMSDFEKVAAKNKDKIPALIKFKCNPYHGLKEREFNLRTSILTGDDKPMISFRIAQLEAIEEAMAEEFKELLQTAFASSILETYIGEV